MSVFAGMQGRSLLSLDDLTDSEIRNLLRLASGLKTRKKARIPGNLLQGRNIALIFEKTSTRTRCAAVVAAVDEGATAEYLDVSHIHLGKKESISDTARVLGRMFDGIVFRGHAQETAVELAKHAGVPVWNGLTDEHHPTQTLADLMTVQENFGEFKGVKMVYVGDGRNNVANSLMLGCAKVGLDFVNCTPDSLSPDPELVERARSAARDKGSMVEISHDPATAVAGANVVYTDVWVSMGEEAETENRIELLRPYQVSMDLMERTGNMASGKVIFLHCLPAIHDRNTLYARESGEMEVTNDVFESEFSKVFDQAENRMHTIKALLVATLSSDAADIRSLCAV
ncbi:MAG: ornithine carbamoyltransferase [Lentisphaerales bacterium]|jgi:ornithine carbamoyltransferase|nr:MAG: ornithine carbamoyltransferase [Lentisphaerales bacterium]